MKKKVAIVGVGYVGINLACAFSKKYNVIAYDVDKKKIKDIQNGVDVTNEIGKDILKYNIKFTDCDTELSDADLIIVAVPTPVTEFNMPDLSCLKEATVTVAKKVKQGALIVYESTVSPGTTEEICKKILEKESNKKCDIDFLLGYSPERINPGDRLNTIYTSTKIISATSSKALEKMKKFYGSFVKNIYSVDSIKIAEATKLIENTQRDVNIAFMNQITQYLTNLGIPRKSVYDAMKSKWNSLDFNPGLVGGHCIGVDPYYLISDGEDKKFDLSLIKEARKINENMSNFILNRISKIAVKGKKIGILGFSYKKDSNDIRNTKVYDIYKKLIKEGYNVEVSDYNLNAENVLQVYDVNFVNKIKDANLIILAVPHSLYLSLETVEYLQMFCNDSVKIIYDIYNVLNIDKFKKDKIKVERM